LICSIKRSNDKNIPVGSEYKKNGQDSLNTAWGVATSGVLMFNGISGEGSDPFYPAIYGKVNASNIGNAYERVDGC